MWAQTSSARSSIPAIRSAECRAGCDGMRCVAVRPLQLGACLRPRKVRPSADLDAAVADQWPGPCTPCAQHIPPKAWRATCGSQVRSFRAVSLRVATTFPARLISREATLGQQGKRPTPCTPRYDKPLGRVKSFGSSRHRRHALTELVLMAGVTWVARSLRGASRSMHRGPHEVNPSPIRARIAKAPLPPLGQQSRPRDHRSFVGRQHELHRDGTSSKRFAKCHLSVPRSHRNSTT